MSTLASYPLLTPFGLHCQMVFERLCLNYLRLNRLPRHPSLAILNASDAEIIRLAIASSSALNPLITLADHIDIVTTYYFQTFDCFPPSLYLFLLFLYLRNDNEIHRQCLCDLSVALNPECPWYEPKRNFAVSSKCFISFFHFLFFLSFFGLNLCRRPFAANTVPIVA